MDLSLSHKKQRVPGGTSCRLGTPQSICALYQKDVDNQLYPHEQIKAKFSLNLFLIFFYRNLAT